MHLYISSSSQKDSSGSIRAQVVECREVEEEEEGIWGGFLFCKLLDG